MDELFDPFEGCSFPSGSHIFNKKGQNEETDVPDYEISQIVNEICQATGEDGDELRDEIISLSQKCSDLDNNHTNKKTQNLQSTSVTDLKLSDPPDVSEILGVDEASITPSSYNVGIINSACQQVLKEMEQQLLSLLKKNRKEQEIVQNFLNTNGKYKSEEGNKKICIKCAGIPYFKDLNGYPPPLNEDVMAKKRKNKLIPVDIISSSPMWSRGDAMNLITAVNRTNPSPDDVDSIDWMKISATDMDGKYSPFECKSKWLMNLKPGINRSRWGSKEIKSLNAVAEKFNYQDWDKIAEELRTGRTGLQCCVQYQTHKPSTSGKWSKKEDEDLQHLVAKYRVKDYIPWVKVAWHFGHRSLKQCMERYTYHLGNIKKGGFTMEEDFVIVYLAKKLKNFGEVAKYLPQRVSTQVRARYEYLVKSSMPKFSKEEDELLMKLMVRYPRNWDKISDSFKNRSKLQCRGRWASIQKNIKLETEISSDSEFEQSQEPLNSENSEANEANKDVLDMCNVKQSRPFLSVTRKNSKQKNKSCPKAYNNLIEYHKYCFKFLFGPKPRLSSNLEECNKLAVKMKIAMASLTVEPMALLSEFDIASLSKNCDFDEEDLVVLHRIVESKSDEEENDKIETSNKIIPPNYINLVGLRTLILGWTKIRTLCSNNDVPALQNRNNEIESGDRLLFSDAKKLFKSRLKSLFTFPLILSNISQKGLELKPVFKSKVKRTVKPLSKKRRKQHAKFMSQTYRNKIQKNLNKKLIKSEKSDLVMSSHEEDSDLSNNAKKYERKKVAKESAQQGPTPTCAESSEGKEANAQIGIKRKRGRPRKVMADSEKNGCTQNKKLRRIDPSSSE